MIGVINFTSKKVKIEELRVSVILVEGVGRLVSSSSRILVEGIGGVRRSSSRLLKIGQHILTFYTV